MAQDFKAWMAAFVDLLNQRYFAALPELLQEDCLLDLPGGSRVVGEASLRDTLSAYIIGHEIRFDDAVAMSDQSGIRGAVEVSLYGRFGEDGTDGASVAAGPAVLVFEREQPEGRLSRLSIYAPGPL